MKTDTAMFFDVEHPARKKFLRLFNGALSWARFPKDKEIALGSSHFIQTNVAQASNYLYAALKDKAGGNSQLHRRRGYGWIFASSAARWQCGQCVRTKR